VQLLVTPISGVFCGTICDTTLLLKDLVGLDNADSVCWWSRMDMTMTKIVMMVGSVLKTVISGCHPGGCRSGDPATRNTRGWGGKWNWGRGKLGSRHAPPVAPSSHDYGGWTPILVIALIVMHHIFFKIIVGIRTIRPVTEKG
jgi:hypothetical protein